MIERYIHKLNTDAAAGEEPAATRERLRGSFPAGASRRMSQLGMLVGKVLGDLDPKPEDAIVYATEYGESRSLEAFLDSFPAASPTLFQCSIHPSGVQQVMIGRQKPVGEFFPLTGSRDLPLQALLVAAVSDAARVLVCGGEERGGWLRDCEGASERAFAFALESRRDAAGAVARWRLCPTEENGELSLPAWFDLLQGRTDFRVVAGTGWRLEWEWLAG